MRCRGAGLLSLLNVRQVDGPSRDDEPRVAHLLHDPTGDLAKATWILEMRACGVVFRDLVFQRFNDDLVVVGLASWHETLRGFAGDHS